MCVAGLVEKNELGTDISHKHPKCLVNRHHFPSDWSSRNDSKTSITWPQESQDGFNMLSNAIQISWKAPKNNWVHEDCALFPAQNTGNIVVPDECIHKREADYARLSLPFRNLRASRSKQVDCLPRWRKKNGFPFSLCSGDGKQLSADWSCSNWVLLQFKPPP